MQDNNSVSSIMKRRLKSLTERILFIDSNLIYDENNILGIQCQILSSTNQLYDIKIWNEISTIQDTGQCIKCSCSCLDYTMRGNNCKHIYWLGGKKFGTMDPDLWLEEQYNAFLSETWLIENDDNIRGRNNDCPICLEEIDYENEKTITCRLQCNNSVHSICWNRYYYISGNTNCVFCRSQIVRSIL